MFVPRPKAGEVVMAGLAAGIVTEAEVNTGMPGTPSRFSGLLANPATWSYIWAIAAFAYLIAIYMGTLVIRKKG